MPICPLDIVIAVDLSNSTTGPSSGSGSWYGVAGRAYEAERKLLENLIDNLTPGMLAGEIQVGVTFWATSAASLNPDGFSMSSNPYGDLSTNNTPNNPLALQDPNGDWHSVISKKMYDFYVGGLGGGTTLNAALLSVFQVGATPGVLNLKTTSDFASQYPIRSNDPNFSQVGVIVTDSQGPSPSTAQLASCSYQSSQLPSNPTPPSGPAKQYVFGCTVLPHPFPTTPGPGLYDNVRDTLDSITCNQNAGSNPWNTSPSGSAGNYGFYVDTNALLGSNQHISTVTTAIIDRSCSPTISATYVCSGASGVGHPGGTPWDCYNPGTGLGTSWSACIAACQAPITYNCSGAPLWDCYVAPGSSGQYTGPNALTDCQVICKAPIPYIPSETGDIVSWNCTIDKYGIGQCNSVLGTGGTYATKALCLTVCEQVPILPTIGFPDTWKCHIPWHSTVGTCTKMTDGSGTYTTEQDCIDNCLHVRVTGSFEDTWGWNCDNSTQTCSGPVIGGTYLTQTDCQQYCVGTIGIGTLCDRIRSCPCGWAYNQTTQECESPGLTQTMIIDAIENCITFQNLPHQPVVGDIWANLSPSNIPPLYAWSAAEVVEVGGQIQGISSIETRSQC